MTTFLSLAKSKNIPDNGDNIIWIEQDDAYEEGNIRTYNETLKYNDILEFLKNILFIAIFAIKFVASYFLVKLTFLQDIKKTTNMTILNQIFRILLFYFIGGFILYIILMLFSLKTKLVLFNYLFLMDLFSYGFIAIIILALKLNYNQLQLFIGFLYTTVLNIFIFFFQKKKEY